MLRAEPRSSLFLREACGCGGDERVSFPVRPHPLRGQHLQRRRELLQKQHWASFQSARALPGPASRSAEQLQQKPERHQPISALPFRRLHPSLQRLRLLRGCRGGGGGGGGGARRGAGETKLELDRRHLHHRIEHLEGRLKELEKRRGETRRARQKNNVPVVALVGYTNVGKSSLLNALCGEQIFEADMLFATLDPTARKLVLPSGLQIILVDTVGFVSRLPHHLVEAFKSTLEEAAFADVIIKVADAGDAQAAEQLAVTDEVLGSLDCADIPQLVVYNKCDTANTVAFDPDILLTSAKTGYGLPALLAKLDEVLNHRVRTIEIVLPYDKLALADILRSRGSVAAEEYREDGVYYRGTVKIDDLHRFEEFLV